MFDMEEGSQEESVKERYEANEYPHANKSGVELNERYTNFPIVDIKMRHRHNSRDMTRKAS
jgi:hypothetical protein